jgi:hypothetical protein
LPDNRRVLIGHIDEGQSDGRRQTIALLNPQTDESQDFGTRFAHDSSNRPGWIPSLNAVVYPDSFPLTPPILSPDGRGWLPQDSVDFQRRLWLSQGDSTRRRTLVDERVTVNSKSPSKPGEHLTVAASPDGSEIVYLDSVGRQLYVEKLVQGAFQRAPSPSFDATQWTYRPGHPGWNMTWRPNSTQVFHSDGFGLVTHFY